MICKVRTPKEEATDFFILQPLFSGDTLPAQATPLIRCQKDSRFGEVLAGSHRSSSRSAGQGSAHLCFTNAAGMERVQTKPMGLLLRHQGSRETFQPEFRRAIRDEPR